MSERQRVELVRDPSSSAAHFDRNKIARFSGTGYYGKSEPFLLEVERISRYLRP
jgi:hypothetical protein